METKNKNIQDISNQSGPDATATHSGWMHFYQAYATYRNTSMLLGKNVLGNNLGLAVQSLSEYHSSLYSMAQQIFSFYETKVEDTLTNEWLDLGDKVNDFLSKISDKDFRNQMALEGYSSLERPLKVSLLKYFNKVDRMAAEAGLHVGHEMKGSSEPKKGLIGFGK